MAELGRIVHRDSSYLAKIERGERSIPAELARDCDRALGDDGTLVRLHAMVTASDRPQASAQGADPVRLGVDEGHVAKTALHVANRSSSLVLDTAPPAPLDEGEEVSVPARTPDGKVVFVNVSRRLFLGGLAASAVSVPAVAPMKREPSIPVQRRATPAPAPDLHPVEHFEQMRQVLIDSDNMFGPEQIIPTVDGQIRLIQNLRRSMRGADQRSLLRMQSKYAELDAWFHQDYGDHATAEYWMNRALEWSHGAMDHELTVFILARKAQLAGDMGDPNQTVDLGAAAEDMAAPGSRLATIAATYGAHGYALQGELSDTMRAYDHARELLESMEADPNSPWGAWLDASYIEVARNRSLVLLGEYTQAAQGFEAALAALPADFRRDRGVYMARAARAYAGAEDVDHAAELGLQALAVGVETKSGRILTELAGLDDELATRQTPMVIEFRDAIADTIGRQT